MSVFEEQEVRKNQEIPITAKIDIFRIIKRVILGDSIRIAKPRMRTKKACRPNGITSFFLS